MHGGQPSGDGLAGWTTVGSYGAQPGSMAIQYGYFSLDAAKSNATYGAAATVQPAAIRLLAIVKF